MRISMILLSLAILAVAALPLYAGTKYLSDKKLAYELPDGWESVGVMTLRNLRTGLSINRSNAMSVSFHPMQRDLSAFSSTGGCVWVVPGSKSNLEQFARAAGSMKPDQNYPLDLNGVIFMEVRDEAMPDWNRFSDQSSLDAWVEEFDADTLFEYESVTTALYQTRDDMREIIIEISSDPEESPSKTYCMIYREFPLGQSALLLYQDSAENYPRSIGPVKELVYGFHSYDAMPILNYIVYAFIAVVAAGFLFAMGHALLKDKQNAGNIQTIAGDAPGPETPPAAPRAEMPDPFDAVPDPPEKLF